MKGQVTANHLLGKNKVPFGSSLVGGEGEEGEELGKGRAERGWIWPRTRFRDSGRDCH